MLRPTVIKAIPKDDYKLRLEFENGEKKTFYVKPYFFAVKTNGFNIIIVNMQIPVEIKNE